MKFSIFQMALIGGIIVMIIVAGLIFSGLVPLGRFKKDSQEGAKVTMWGTFPKSAVSDAISDVNTKNKKLFEIKYTVLDEDSYEQKFVDALASGQIPDILILSHDLILKHKNKLYITSFETYNERAFKDAFIEEGELFLRKEGIVGFPFIVDPIVLYWNRDLFSKAGLAAPPKYWDEFSNNVQLLTDIDIRGNILQSGAALGEFANVSHAKEILSFLVLQTGNPVVDKERLEIIFDQSGLLPENPMQSVLRFYTEFANPSKVFYSWNRGMPNNKESFLAGKLAVYFGYASEIDSIKEGNPHLNFDVAEVPQIRDFSIEATFGRMYGLVVPKTSTHIGPALGAIFKLTSSDTLAVLKDKTRLPPVSRSLLAQKAADPEMAIFYKAAVQARGWLEPDPRIVSDVFQNMVESVVVGKKGIFEAVSSAASVLNAELKKLK